MAKESMKAREVKRAKLVARYAEKRAALKKIIATSEDYTEAYEAARKLQAIPKNANPIRLHIVVRFQDALRDISDSLDCLVFNFVRWHLQV